MIWASRLVCPLTFAAVICSGVAQAQELAQETDEFQSRDARLYRLVEVLGRTHHLRGTCAHGESEIWRNRMRRLVEAERPSVNTRKALIEAFNASFYDAKSEYPSCTPGAREEAAALAAEGRMLAASLAPPYRDTSHEGN